MTKTQNALIVMVLSWLLGYFGADRFYQGQIGWGVLKLLTLGACGIWWLVDAVYYTYQAGLAAQIE
jgi:TM2 domain-containing membrane protein YozV